MLHRQHDGNCGDVSANGGKKLAEYIPGKGISLLPAFLTRWPYEGHHNNHP